jgi:hypothetical protein
MELFAVFETWHIGDGNYPPLKKDQPVNLSFEFQPDELSLAESDAPSEFHHLGQAQYRFSGTVLRVYSRDGGTYPIVVIEADHFRFYMHSPLAATFNAGDIVTGRGTLLFDHYLWVEFLSTYPDPPDLFYKLRVGDIWRRQLPERFISRSNRATSWPTRANPEDYGPNNINSVDQVTDSAFVDYVIQFLDNDVLIEGIPLTFCS